MQDASDAEREPSTCGAESDGLTYSVAEAIDTIGKFDFMARCTLGGRQCHGKPGKLTAILLEQDLGDFKWQCSSTLGLRGRPMQWSSCWSPSLRQRWGTLELDPDKASRRASCRHLDH